MMDLNKIPFIQAHTHSPRGVTPSFVIIHAMSGYFQPTIALFREGPNSAHYLVSKAGDIVCMVKPEEKGQHVVNFNTPSIGIEHEDARYMPGGLYTCLNDPTWFTPKQEEASAQLVAALIKKFNIHLEHVIGHNDPFLRAKGNTHADPGPYFPWSSYRQRIGQLIVS